MSQPDKSHPTKRLFSAIFGLVAMIGAYLLLQNGLNQLAEARQMERLPYTPLAGVLEGPYMLRGQVASAGNTIQPPYSRTPSVYFRYALEEEYRDSDGDRRTRTLESGQEAIPFLLTDATGKISIAPDSGSDVTWRINRTFQHREGNRIYSEWSLSSGDTVNVLGRYDDQQHQLVFSGLEPFNLPPQVSSRPLDIAAGDKLFDVAIRISAATGLLAIGVALLLTFARVHRFWVFVVAMLVMVTGSLCVMGFAKLNSEWTTVASLYQNRHQAIGSTPGNPEAQADLAAFAQLIHRGTSGWLDNWMYRRTIGDSLPAAEPEPSTQALIQQLVAAKPQNRYQHTYISWGLSAAAAIAAIMLLVAAIRKVKFKRLIEAIPTSSTAGMSYGLTEITGKVVPHEESGTLADPLRSQPCVAFQYRVEEKRGSDKGNNWRTIENKSERIPFWLDDEVGRALIYPQGADINYPRRHSETRGDRRYTVHFLPPDARLFCLGFAGFDHEHPEQLALQEDGDNPFLLSAKTESEIVEGSGSKGFLITSVALALALFSTTSVLAADGGFSPGNLLASALVVPVMLCLYLGILHYNDIVFLRKRVDRAEANIDTILQQRYDLWPNLEKAVKALLAHEQQLQKTLAGLRAARPKDLENTQAREDRLEEERKFTATLQARMEDYPDLKSHPVVGRFMEIMAETESYLSLLRNSQTDSATVYNTRIQSFPDLILARLFGFQPVTPLGKNTESA